MPRINGERLLGDLRRMAEFGRYKTGVHRPHLSPQDVESRHWLCERMREAGLDAAIDGVGNVVGRSSKRGARLLIGSHTDTQPRGGWLDGVMGVIYGLEVARALGEEPSTAGLAIDVASWADEEGHWSSMIGSKSFIGEINEAEIDAARHRDDGTKLRDGLKAAGLDRAPRVRLEEGRYRCYLEAHIEQGGVLEAAGKRIGVVTGIVGIAQFHLAFQGAQNHAGTTPMPIRKDAGAAMMRLYNEVMTRFPSVAGPRSVWTVGKMTIEPGAPSIIPGKAEMILQFRDTDAAALDRMEACLLEIVAQEQKRSPCAVACTSLDRIEPAPMDERLLEALDAAGEKHAPGLAMRMPSGAGHDAQILARRLPAAMMFVPSIGGVSHHFSENTDDADIVLGCQVFADAAASISNVMERSLMYGAMRQQLANTLSEIAAAGLHKPERVIATPQGGHIRVAGGREVLNLCANNYLGLASHPAVIKAAHEALDRWGYGMASVRFICGTQEIHKELERRISQFLGTEDTILYSSCFDANGGLFETILGEEDAVISDELNHASIIDGIRLSKARRMRYRNGDLADLEAQLKDAAVARFRMIATDGVFSMDGYYAKLKEICDLADKYDALVMVDDSHAVGFTGDKGRGSHERAGVMGRIDINTGTLGKALGGANGGYTSGRKEIIDLLRQRSRPYLFSNSIPPAIAGASIAALDLLSSSTALIDRLRENTTFFRSEMGKLGFDILPGEHPIAPIMLGDAALAGRFAEAMLAKGVYVIGFSYPVVPKGKARIRTQMSAALTRADLEFAVAKFAEVGREMKLIA